MKNKWFIKRKEKKSLESFMEFLSEYLSNLKVPERRPIKGKKFKI